jgi:hypothetical protein
MSDLDAYRARAAQLRAQGMSPVAASLQAMDETTEDTHQREEAWLDAQEARDA